MNPKHFRPTEVDLSFPYSSKQSKPHLLIQPILYLGFDGDLRYGDSKENNDKLQFIEAGASHDNSPDEAEDEEEDLVQAPGWEEQEEKPEGFGRDLCLEIGDETKKIRGIAWNA